ncbi:MAG: ABC transporter permease subunit [Firmicutes bacterium]|nr:ABC transporter permease subunit [Bacillota bacterium]
MELDVMKKKNRKFMLFWIALIGITGFFMVITKYDPIKSFTSIPKAIVWTLTNFYPNSNSIEKLPSILSKLKETIFLSIAATTTASAFALLFGLFGSKTTKINNLLGVLSRTIASIFRNIPIVAWAMILLFSFGQNALTGYFALFFVTFGFLTRAFIETIDEASYESVEALRATGATYFQIVFQGVIPSSIPQIISWVLFMTETNIRSSTLVGILTGTGVGFVFNIYYKSMDYNSASLVVISIILTVFAIEITSNYIRRVIL